jgi:hypothetical protein
MDKMPISKYKVIVALLFIAFYTLFFGYLLFFKNTHPFILLGVGALLVVWSLFVIGISFAGLKRPRNYGKVAIVGIFAGGLVIFITLVFSWEPLSYLRNQSMFTALEPACNGQTFPENPAFQENGYNPLVAIDPPARAGKWSVKPIGLGWTSENPNEITLIACFHEGDILKQTCTYT